MVRARYKNLIRTHFIGLFAIEKETIDVEKNKKYEDVQKVGKFPQKSCMSHQKLVISPRRVLRLNQGSQQSKKN